MLGLLFLSWTFPVVAGISGQLQDQSVLNAAAHSVFSARLSERIIPFLRELHWLRVPERLTFRKCVLPTAVFMEQRRRTLLGAFSGHLMSILDVVCVLPTPPYWWYRPARRPYLPVASARTWNSLPSSVRNAPSLTTFRRELKTVLFRRRLAIVIVLYSITVVCPRLQY